MSNITALKRDGTEIMLDDEVELKTYHHKVVGIALIVFSITADDNCESGFMINVHQKDDETKKIMKTVNGQGLDTNWFTLINKTE